MGSRRFLDQMICDASEEVVAGLNEAAEAFTLKQFMHVRSVSVLIKHSLFSMLSQAAKYLSLATAVNNAAHELFLVVLYPFADEK